MGEFGDGAGHLHAGRSGPNDHEGEEAPPVLGRRHRLGVFEGGQDAPADAGGIVDLLEAGRHALPFVVAEIGVARSRRQHQLIVFDLVAVDLDRAALPVHAGNPAEHDTYVGRAAQDRADRRGDLCR